MAFDLQTVMHAATVTLNMTLSVAVGAGMSSLWLSRGASAWAMQQRKQVQPVRAAATAFAMLVSAVLLWLESAVMAEVPIAQAREAVWSMLSATHLGTAWMIGIVALAISLAASVAPAPDTQRRWLLQLSMLGLGVFLYSRSMVSHAASDGDISVAMLADWLHLMLISLWVGEVLLAGLLILNKPIGMLAHERKDAACYVESLSTSATYALVGIVATGLFSAWHNLGGLSGLSGNTYGTTLLIKLGLVALAIILGGFNRFKVMPLLIGTLQRGDSASMGAQRRFSNILRIESLVLLGVVLTAAVLSATSPPTAS